MYFQAALCYELFEACHEAMFKYVAGAVLSPQRCCAPSGYLGGKGVQVALYCLPS